MTVLPNPFDPDSTVNSPVIVDTATVDLPVRTAAASDITRIAHNPVTRAVEIRTVNILNSGAPQPRGEPAQINATQPAGYPNIRTNHIRADLSDWDINGSENIHEIFAYARKLCREQSPDIENHRFAPNYSGMFHAAVNEEVWDAPPLFLQRVR